MPKNARDKELARAALKREQEKLAAKRKKRFIRVAAGLVMAAVVVAAALALLGGGGKEEAKSTAASRTPTASPTPDNKPKARDGNKPEKATAPRMTIDAAKTYTAVLDTTFGTIKIDLAPASSPATVNNFVYLADHNKYDGVLFHRISNSLSVIQGGDVTCKDPGPTCGQGGPGYTFDDELTGKEKYTRGVVAMANAGPNTNGSQFFIVTGSSAQQLPPSYTIFGHLADAASLKVAEKIQSQPVDGETPVSPIVIDRVEIEVGG